MACKIALGPILSSWSPFYGRHTDTSEGLTGPSSSFPQLDKTPGIQYDIKHTQKSREDFNFGVRVRLEDALPSKDTIDSQRSGILTDLRRSRNVIVWAQALSKMKPLMEFNSFPWE